MSEEKQACVEPNDCKCNCFKKLVAIIVGSFIGAYLALMLFTTLNKPCPCAGKMPPQTFAPPMEAPQGFNGRPDNGPPHMREGEPRPDFRPDGRPGPRPEGRPAPRPHGKK